MDKLSPTPKLGLTLYEYFSRGFSLNLHNGAEVIIPNTVEVTQDSLLVKDSISPQTGQYVDIHEGGEVNKIIK